MAELTHIEEMLDRMVAMGKECIDALEVFPTNTDGVPYWFYAQESFPYWTFRLPEGTMELDSENLDRRTYTVIGSLYCGYVTEGYTGELERRMMRCKAGVPAYFNARPYNHDRQFLTLTTATALYPDYNEPMADVDPRGIRCTDFVDFARQQAVTGGGSIAASVLGTDYVFEVPFMFRTREEW